MRARERERGSEAARQRGREGERERGRCTVVRRIQSSHIGTDTAIPHSFIRTSIHHEYDFPQRIGALPSEIGQMAAMPWSGIVFMMNTLWD